MSKLTRRLFLGSAPAAALVTAPAVAAPMTALERYNYHLAEFKKAAEELDPRIGYWYVAGSEDDDLAASLSIVAMRHTGKYQGDGTYENGRASVLGRHTLYQVRLLPDRKDGHRSFDVRNAMDRMVLTEPQLNTFIGEKVQS